MKKINLKKKRKNKAVNNFSFHETENGGQINVRKLTIHFLLSNRAKKLTTSVEPTMISVLHRFDI